jgi:hypothetical protein
VHRRHKGDAQAFSHASRGAEGPGVLPRTCPGLRHLRRSHKHSQSGEARSWPNRSRPAYMSC